jgi:hypothetical protein
MSRPITSALGTNSRSTSNRFAPSAIGPPKTAAAVCCQAPNTSLVPVYDRITFFGNSALRIS